MTLDVGCCLRAQEIQGRHSGRVFQDAVGIRTQGSGSFDHPDGSEDLGPGPYRDRGPGALACPRVDWVANNAVRAVDVSILLCVLGEFWDVTREDSLLPDIVDLLVGEAGISDDVL